MREAIAPAQITSIMSKTLLAASCLLSLTIQGVSAPTLAQDDPIVIEIEGCNEFQANVFQLDNLATVSDTFLVVSDAQVEADKAAFRTSARQQLREEAAAKAAELGVEQPACPTEECESANGINCVPTLRIDEAGDVTETTSEFTIIVNGIPLTFCQIQWTFAASVSVDVGCDACVVDPTGIG